MILSSEAIKIITEYAKENMRICQDNIRCDPVLSGGLRGKDDFIKSEDLQIDSTIHSAKYHAAKDILLLCGVDGNSI